MNDSFNVVLVEPQIPQNTGNIGRLCLATKARLHLIKPYGFDISEKAVRRAGLDYWKHLEKFEYDSFPDFLHKTQGNGRHWYITKFANKSLYEFQYTPGDFFVFGKETTDLKDVEGLGISSENSIQIPMFDDRVRSLNLGNAASIVLYEAIRQQL